MNYTYTLVRSDRQTLAVQVKADLSIWVRAPRRTTQRQIDAFLKERDAWIARALADMASLRNTPERTALTAEEKRRYLDMAKATLPEKIAYWSEKMELCPAGVRFNYAEKQFGSCTGKNVISFSYQLMRYPPACIDYVVVHELAHIRYHNHSAAFWALVEAYIPDYKERRAYMRGKR